MKKSRLILSGLTVALLGASAAMAAPNMPQMGGFGRHHHGGPGMPPPPPHHMQHEMERIPDNAPEEIKAAYKEMRSLRRDLNLELRKDNPDAAKAMEMLKKSEELHMKVREWEVKQILEGNRPKPREPFPWFGHKPGPKPGPDGKPAPKTGPDGNPGLGPKPFAPNQGGNFVHPPMVWWTPFGPQMMPMPRPGFGPMPHCHCGGHMKRYGMNGHGPVAPAPEKAPVPTPEQAPAQEQKAPAPAPEKPEDAKL